MTKGILKAAAATFLSGTILAGTAAARDPSTFGQGIGADVAPGYCPDVVVLNVPFCTDETGQAQCISGDRRSIAAQAVAAADTNDDGLTYAFIQSGASHLASDAHNVGLTQERAAFTRGLVEAAGARIVGYQAVFGESRASGGPDADFNFDRFGQALLTDDPSLVVVDRNGYYVPSERANVISYNTPPCDLHRRDVAPRP